MILMQGYWYQRGREIESYQVNNQEHVLLFGLEKLHQFDIGKTSSDELKLKNYGSHWLPFWSRNVIGLAKSLPTSLFVHFLQCNPFHSQDLISYSPYYLPYSSCNVSWKISFVILLTICHTGLVMLVWRILYQTNQYSPNWYFSLFSLPRYCSDIVQRNSLLVHYGS